MLSCFCIFLFVVLKNNQGLVMEIKMFFLRNKKVGHTLTLVMAA